MKVTPLRQADPRWSHTAIGDSTVGRIGCLATCLTMAHNAIYGDALGVHDAGSIITEPGGFNGNLTLVPGAAKALGLDATEKERIRGTRKTVPLDAGWKARLAIDGGGLCIVHVDHGGGPEGDHFILGFGVDDGIQGDHIEDDMILCADPAPGTVVRLAESGLSGTSLWKNLTKHYVGVGIIPVYRSKS